MGAEVHLRGRREEQVDLLVGNARLAGHGADLVMATRRVVEQRTRLGHYDERVFAHVGDDLIGFLVEIGHVAVLRGELDAGFEHLHLVCHFLAHRHARLELALQALEPGVADGVFVHRPDLGTLELAYGLPRARHHTAQPVDIVAEELHAHGRCLARRVDVDRVAGHREGAGAIELLEPLVAAGYELLGNFLVREHLSCRSIGNALIAGDDKRREHVARSRRHRTQQGTGRGHDDNLTAQRQGADGLRARPHHLEVGLLVRPRHVSSLGKHEDVFAPHKRRHRMSEALRRLFAAHDHQHGTRLTCVQRRHEKRTRRGDDPDRRVLRRAELVENRCQHRRREKFALQSVYEHKGTEQPSVTCGRAPRA